ncbi:hypothetical protein CDAR_462051 [Caerostris darwini]|uniref:Allorecognition 2 n=1 Tax=Caerostris darwini TaxID=1538125 RepID=A0AAV4WSI6_9ARAC|nr:hypothetical protein CDAR_462051 [Caerostris darwini]
MRLDNEKEIFTFAFNGFHSDDKISITVKVAIISKAHLQGTSSSGRQHLISKATPQLEDNTSSPRQHLLFKATPQPEFNTSSPSNYIVKLQFYEYDTDTSAIVKSFNTPGFLNVFSHRSAIKS